MITRYTSQKVAEPAPELWSNCIVCDGIAYIAGLTSRNTDGVTIDGANEYEQTKIIFEKHRALIEAAGGKMADFTNTCTIDNAESRRRVRLQLPRPLEPEVQPEVHETECLLLACHDGDQLRLGTAKRDP